METFDQNELSDKKSITVDESLAIIDKMVQSAKNDHRENGLPWLMWGWLLFSASVISAILIQFDYGRYAGPTWTGMLVIGLIIHIVFMWKKDDLTTYTQELLDKSGIAFFISLFIVIIGTNVDWKPASFGYYSVLYGFWLFMHGTAIRFRPLIVGASVNWIAAIIIFFLGDLKHIMIVSAIAVFIGYIIPGYMLRKQFKNRKTVKSV